MSTQNLLVELFVEELPPKALRKLGHAFASELYRLLRLSRFIYSEPLVGDTPDPAPPWVAFASPRRLAALIRDVQSVGEPSDDVVKLMPVAVGLDASGHATPALLKKLAALGETADAVAKLERQVVGNAELLVLNRETAGATLAEGLQKALAEAITKLPIPKVMSYQLESGCELPGWSSVSFVRPAHGLVALHGADVVPVQALGLTAGRDTHGHRFEARVDPVVLRDADSYAQQLAEEGAVIASFEARRAEIVRQLAIAADKVGGGVKPIEDEDLLDEVTALVERPNVLVCEFEPQFLEVPQECLILTMKANQKYFPLLDAQGKLTNRFLVVSNITPDDASAVVQGNERVVRPRLSDAKFFFDQDRRKTLASRVESLAKVVYHSKLGESGTQGARAMRVRAIARAIAQRLGDAHLVQQADQAAHLAKADLVTDMVGEFPELQGTMGRYYALHDGLDASVADAIEDHYKPRFAGDTLPRGEVGVVVALADKLETLVGMFGIGNLPTGDKDPFALRRHALGVARMMSERLLPLDLEEIIEIADKQFPPQAKPDDSSKTTKIVPAVLITYPMPTVVTEVYHFVLDRFEGVLREQGYSAQEVEAVLALRPQRLGEVPKRLEAVRAFATLPEAAALAAANKRIGNILKKAPDVDPHVSELLLKAPAEAALFGAMNEVVPHANAQFEAGDYTASLQTLAALRVPVDAFFESVMVNVEELELRLNRLGLLKRLHDAMNRVADLSRLVGTP